MPKIIFSVSNDLSTDQRVHKMCTFYHDMGYEVLLVGRKLPKSTPLHRPYKTRRMRLIFKRGFLFYAEFNKRLFLTLLCTKKNLLYANDLDTLLANFLVAKLTRTPLIYDSHELFTEIPELNNRPRVKRFWLAIERPIFKRLKHVFTVNQSIAKIYEETYKVKVNVLKNFAPRLTNLTPNETLAAQIKGQDKMLILQGAGINKDRGAEEAVLMMQFLEKTRLVIIGGGDVFQHLRNLVAQHELQDKVLIKDKMKYSEMMEYTKIADLGLSLDKPTNLNYKFSLPNKIFDYMQAELPMLVSEVIEVANLVRKEDIGTVLKSYEPKEMAMQVVDIFENQERLLRWQTNLKSIAPAYSWEAQLNTLKPLFKQIG